LSSVSCPLFPIFYSIDFALTATTYINYLYTYVCNPFLPKFVKITLQKVKKELKYSQVITIFHSKNFFLSKIFLEFSFVPFQTALFNCNGV